MDNQHLKIFLEQLFDLLRIRSSEETLSFESLSFGLRQLPVSPRIHFTRFDYEMITEQGRLTDEKGNLDVSAFTAVMHRQVRHYVRRKLQRSVSETEVAQDFSLLASVQLILSEAGDLHSKYDLMDTRLHQMQVCNMLCDTSSVLLPFFAPKALCRLSRLNVIHLGSCVMRDKAVLTCEMAAESSHLPHPREQQ